MAESGAHVPPDAPAAERSVPGLTPSAQRRLRRLFRALNALSASLAAWVAGRAFITPLTRPISRDEAALLADAHSHRLATAAGVIQVYDWPAAGPTVLIMHGWISHAARLRAMVLALRARGLRVLAFDAPGHGRSPGRSSTLEQFRLALGAVHQRFGPAQGLLAHSLGALAASQWLAADSAARSVRAAVLVGTPCDAAFLLDTFVAALALPERVSDRLRARYRPVSVPSAAGALSQRSDLALLLVHGSADQFVPSEFSLQIGAAVPAARVLIVPGADHSAPLRDPSTVSVMADFLTERLTS